MAEAGAAEEKMRSGHEREHQQRRNWDAQEPRHCQKSHRQERVTDA